MKQWIWPKLVFMSKFKFFALLGIAICVLSLLVHLAKYSTVNFIPYRLRVDDFYPTEKIFRYKKFWGPVHVWRALQPHADPRGIHPGGASRAGPKARLARHSAGATQSKGGKRDNG